MLKKREVSRKIAQKERSIKKKIVKGMIKKRQALILSCL